jgi:hypothetical protein
VDYPFEKDPRFAKLPYSDQQQIRLNYAARKFGKDQRFLNLPENDKLLIMQNVLTRAPVFENPEVGAQFMQAAKNPVLYQTFANANKQSGITGIALGMVGKIMPQAQVQKEMLHGGDAVKGTAYIQNLIDSSTSLSPIAKMLPKLGTIAGFVADLASYATITHGIPTTAAAGSLAGTSERVVANMAKLGSSGTRMQLARWGLSDLAPHVAKMAGMGSIGVVSENVRNLLNGENIASIGNIAKTFGTYAAGDTLFWNALSWGGPFLRLSGKVLKSFGRSAEKVAESLYVTDAAGKRRPMDRN